MLQHVPHWLGEALGGVRAGSSGLTAMDERLAAARDQSTMTLTSAAFADGATIPARFTADGEGVSPPLDWGGAPAGAAALALIVEDADSPTPEPLVHAIVWNLAPDDGEIAEGAIAKATRLDVGRNSYRAEGWLPPDPPTGHGPHRYVFQLFALARAIDFDHPPGRSALADAMAGQGMAVAVLVGIYERA